MELLKADLHIHTAEDFYDPIEWDARRIVDEGARRGFRVLAVTNHMSVCFSDELAQYAASKNILLIPGCEAQFSSRHVLLLNPTPEAARCESFDELREERRRDHPMAVIAPHPFYPSRNALRGWLYKHADVFDAIEWCSYYFGWMNFNVLARRASRLLGLPMIGNSDTHFPKQFGGTYSLIEAEPTAEGVVEAIKAGRCRVVTTPLTINFFTLYLGMRGVGLPDKIRWKRNGHPGKREI